MSSTDSVQLAVVGGGPAGLARALWEQRSGVDVALLEAADRVGGWVRTVERDGYRLECGPQGYRPNQASDAWIGELELGDDVVPADSAANRRWLFDGRELVELPAKPPQVLRSPLLSPLGKLRLLWEPWVRSSSPTAESVADFVRRRFGRGGVRVVEAMTHGIFAGNAHELEVASAFPVLVDMERDHGSVFRGLKARRDPGAPRRPALCSLSSGMEQTVRAAARALGDAVVTDAPVERIEPEAVASDGYRVHVGGARPRVIQAERVCVTCPPAIAARILAPLDAAFAAPLDGVPTASVASTYLGFSADAVAKVDLNGFGFLAPRGALGPVLGVLYASSVFPDHAPEGHVLLRVMSGGVDHPEEVDRSDEELVDQAVTVLERHLAIDRGPTFRHVERARNAIPQFVAGHAGRMAELREVLGRWPGLDLRGAGYRQISVVGQWAREGSTP